MKIATSMNYIPAATLPAKSAKPLIESGLFESGQCKVLVDASLTHAAEAGRAPGAIPLGGANFHPVSGPGSEDPTLKTIVDVGHTFLDKAVDSLGAVHPHLGTVCNFVVTALPAALELAGTSEEEVLAGAFEAARNLAHGLQSPRNDGGGSVAGGSAFQVKLPQGTVSELTQRFPEGHSANPVLLAFIRKGNDVVLALPEKELQAMRARLAAKPPTK